MVDSNLRQIARDAFGKDADRIQPVRGGDINKAACVEIGGTRYFVKYKVDAPPRFFETEALGLDLLRSAGEIRVPQVISYAEQNDERTGFLALEWIDKTEPSSAFHAKFGRALAALHRHTVPTFGIDIDHVVNGLAQPDPTATNWLAYYRDRRLGPQIEKARRNGLLPPRRAAALDKLMEHIGELLVGLNSVPSLLHGDLWGGNYMSAQGDEPVLYDPHTYYGEREAEIAFTELFGGFAPDFYWEYLATWPLDPGYDYRRPLHQLYHLVTHLNLFGESYGGSVDAVCKFYGFTG